MTAAPPSSAQRCLHAPAGGDGAHGGTPAAACAKAMPAPIDVPSPQRPHPRQLHQQRQAITATRKKGHFHHAPRSKQKPASIASSRGRTRTGEATPKCCASQLMPTTLKLTVDSVVVRAREYLCSIDAGLTIEVGKIDSCSSSGRRRRRTRALRIAHDGGETSQRRFEHCH